MKKKAMMIVAIVLLMMIILLAGSCKKAVFEGGNITFSYNKAKWDLSYGKSGGDVVFCLESDSDYILLTPIEDDGSIFERFHEDFLENMVAFEEYNIEAESKVDLREERGHLYYCDRFVKSGKGENWITFGKALGDIFVVGSAKIEGSENETALQIKTDEVLEILSSIAYSSKQKVRWITRRNDLIDFYERILMAKGNEKIWEESDRTRDSVPDGETAKRIAKEYDDRCGWTAEWGENYEYDISVVYLEQGYMWLVIYREHEMMLDGGSGTVRIRRDNGRITNDTRRVFIKN